MSVGELLGLDGPSALLQEARDSWAVWAAQDARLAEVPGFDDLLAHLTAAPPGERAECLLALAERAAHDGGDDVVAAAALAKVLLPGACVLAGRLTRAVSGSSSAGSLATAAGSDLVGSIDQLVASQLWIEVRTFAWRRLSRVGGNILMNIRSAVLSELGDLAQVERFDRTWARTRCVETQYLDRPFTQLSVEDEAREALSSREELALVLAWAREHEVISAQDESLIWRLLREAPHIEVRATSRGRGNLCSDRLAARVAPQLGVSSATVRRRAARSVRALTDAVPADLCA